jgi:DNA-binding NarL/FixJ family response regulator
MPKIEEFAFLNVLILGKDKIVIDSLNLALAELHPRSNLLRFAKIEKLKEQLNISKPHFLIIDLHKSGKGIKEFIAYCKKKHPRLKILTVGNLEDISIVKDFFEIGISGFVSSEITSYELKIAVQKIFSGEKYVGTRVSGKLISSFFGFQKRV